MFRFRQMEMSEQMAKYPSGSLAEGLPRVWAGVHRPLLTYSVTAGIAGIIAGPDAQSIGKSDPAGCAAGGAGVGINRVDGARQSRAGNKKRRTTPPPEPKHRRAEAAIVALAWTLVFYVLIVMNMGLDWDRYTLPLMVFAALWAGVGIGWLVGLVARLVGRNAD